MSDKDLLNLISIIDSANKIQNYTKHLRNADKFFEDEKSFDAVMMRLQSIGENIKKINKINGDFFEINLQFDTNNVIRFRDLISHHYEKLDTEIVFEICTIDIPELKQKIQTFLSNSNDQSV